MFGKKRGNSAVVRTLVGGNTRVHGDIEFTGGFHVDGYVKGNVEAVNEGPATLSISEDGCIEGLVVVPNLILNGTVKGDVRVTERIELGPRARVIGDVQYKLIEMAIGAEVNGKLTHEIDAAAKRPITEPPSPELVPPVKAAGESGT